MNTWKVFLVEEGDLVYEIGHLCQWTLPVLLHRYDFFILTGFLSWLQLVAGKDTLSMWCSLHGWIPQQMTDRECVGEWEFRTLGMGQLHKRYKQSCIFLMEIRLWHHGHLLRLLQPPQELGNALFWIWLQLLQFLSVCVFWWELLCDWLAVWGGRAKCRNNRLRQK